jgi:hypothetical protein
VDTADYFRADKGTCKLTTELNVHFQGATKHYAKQQKEMIFMKPITTTQTSILTPTCAVHLQPHSSYLRIKLQENLETNGTLVWEKIQLQQQFWLPNGHCT